MAGTEYQQIVLWGAYDQSLRDQSLRRNVFSLGSGASLDATGGKFTGGCYHSNGASTAYASTPHSDAQRFGASGDFFCSAWVKLEGTGTGSYQVIMGKARSGSQQFYFCFNQAHTNIYFFHSTDGGGGGGVQFISAAVTIVEGQWYHCAASRSGGTVRIFLDGVQVASGTLTGTYNNSTAVLTVGGIDVSGFTYPLKGSINDAQLIVGSAVYTSNFTPPSAYVTPYTLNVSFDSNRGKVLGATRPLGAMAPKITKAARNSSDIYHFGAYKVTGTVKEYDTPTNIPLKRKVVLLREPDLKAIAATWSDPVTGVYTFPNVTNAYKYTVIAFDYALNYRAVVGDRQTAEPM